LAIALYLLIVTKRDPDSAKSTLTEWLRSERRLGIGHYPRLAPTSAPAPAAPQSTTTAHDDRERARPLRSAVTASFLADDAQLPPLCTTELSVQEARQALADLDAASVKSCTKCVLHKNRTQTVFGTGNPRPDIAFVGEGPGADEDRQGEPFVGRAGQLLTRMIAAMTLTRDQVYICNVVKCRPPENRTPTDDEMATCSPYLWRQLAILRPKVIVALGRPATQTLLVTKSPIGQLRGEFQDFPPTALAHLGLPPARLMPTFHPAYLLRSPGEKAKAWEDLQQVMRYLGLAIPHAPRHG
jgi:uracil-DNA glycosylase family 4